jgi:hypothetical protein
MDTSASATASTQNDTHTLQRASVVAFATIATAYVVTLGWFTQFPFQDFPNHLTRATVLADLFFSHGATFGQMFEFHFMPVPYILGDVLLAGLVGIFGPTGAGVLWNSIVLLSWPAALLFLTYVTGVPRNGRLFVLFLSLYLATDWFFLLAFTQFRLGMALMVVALGVAHLLRLRWTAVRFAAFCALLIAGYFTHLVYVIFLAPCLIVTAAIRLYFRRASLRTELALIIPVLIVMLWHFGFADQAYRSEGSAPYTWLWGTVGLKTFALQFEILRFGGRFAKVLMLLFALVVAWGLWRDLRWPALLRLPVVESLALAFTFLCIYFVLPSRYSQAAYVDVRALVLISLFVVLARVYLSEDVRQPAIVLPLAAALALLNLGFLAIRVSDDDAWMKSYRELGARIPKGASVLPIYTSGREGAVSPRLHVSSYLVMDRAAVMPYLFSGDAGHPMKYFRYRNRPYAPTERWYNAILPEPVDWRAIACTYQFLLIGKPYDPSRIRIRTSTVAENESGALLKVDAAPCYLGAANRPIQTSKAARNLVSISRVSALFSLPASSKSEAALCRYTSGPGIVGELRIDKVCRTC